MSTTYVTSASATRVGSWTSYAGGYNGENYYYVPSGTGTNTCSWAFTGLTAGTNYYIALTWYGTTGRATNVPWTISDGSGVRTSGTLNEVPMPIGPYAGGVYFQFLGRRGLSIGIIYEPYPRDHG